MLATYTMNMIHIWRNLIDTIFPPSPSLRILRECAHIPTCQYYAPHRVGDVIALSHYQTPFIKASITAGKFEHNLSALETIGELLREYVCHMSPPPIPERTIFVPIPLHPKREHERGYNQVTIILKAATAQSHWHILPLLQKTQNISPQSHLKRAERLSHLDNVFMFRPAVINWEQITTVILVDDVITTGSTLIAAKKVLLAHLPKHVTLHTLAIAH